MKPAEKVPVRSCPPTCLEFLAGGPTLLVCKLKCVHLLRKSNITTSGRSKFTMAETGKKRKQNDDLGSEKKKKKVSADSTASSKSKKIKVSSVVQAQVSPPVIGILQSSVSP